MSTCKKVIGIIPVRGGSKRIPKKNIKSFPDENGKPLLLHTVECARASGCIDELYICTEDLEISTYAQSIGVNVISHHPDLSTDDSPVLPVFINALNELKKVGRANSDDVVVILRVTSPLRTVDDIHSCVNMFKTRNLSSDPVDSVVSVKKESGLHPNRLKSIDPQSGLLIDTFEPEGPRPTCSSSSLSVYLRNSAVYVTSVTNMVDKGWYWGEKILPYVMPPERSVDINDEYDWTIACLLYKHYVAKTI